MFTFSFVCECSDFGAFSDTKIAVPITNTSNRKTITPVVAEAEKLPLWQ